MIPISAEQFQVLDNAAHMRPIVHGFKVAPLNLSNTLMQLERLGLIAPTPLRRFTLTTKGRNVYLHYVQRYLVDDTSNPATKR